MARGIRLKELIGEHPESVFEEHTAVLDGADLPDILEQQKPLHLRIHRPLDNRYGRLTVHVHPAAPVS